MKRAWRSLMVALVQCVAVLCVLAPAAAKQAAQQPPAMLARGDNFDLELNAGKQAYAAGRLDEAQAHFDRALGAATTDPERASALLYLGVVFAASNRLSEAETAFRMAVKRNPACIDCGFNLGFVLLKESKDEEGVAALKAVLPQLKGTPREREVERFIADPGRIRKDYAPEFSLKTVSGDSVTLDTLKGKVVLMDFWGAWCAPCRHTVPLLKQMAEEFDPAKVAIVSVDEHDPRETWAKYVEQNGMTWAQVRDEDGSLKRAFRVDGFPFSVLLSKDGIILQKFKGWGPGWERVMHDEIEKALAKN
jgi:thiol-disulfide isomerase/thioredoxin